MNAMTAMSTTSIWVHFFSLFFFLGPVSHSPRNGTGFHLSSHTESVLDRSIGRSVTVDAGDAARCHWQWARRVFFCSWWLPLSLCLNVHDGISVMTHDRPPEASWVLTPHVALAASPSPHRERASFVFNVPPWIRSTRLMLIEHPCTNCVGYTLDLDSANRLGICFSFPE